MKIIIILSLCLIFTSFSYSQLEPVYNAKDIKSLKIQTIKSSQQDLQKIIEFDKNGNIIKEIATSKGKQLYETTYKYSNDLLSEKITISDSKNIEKYFYKDNKLSKKTDDNGYATTYEYDNKGKLIKEKYNPTDMGVETEYFYDENGKLSETATSMKYNAVFITDYEYSNNLLIKITNGKNAPGGSYIDSYSIYTYNSGLLTKEEYYTSESEPPEIITYEYTYFN